ncbi:LysR substrate-binding domain-containing protein [Anaeromyxobacter dehalogenans]|uniref:Transcriptional regulator, LysR family n=1 Tax=Anaeromyxobacter dehalogenans (strain 2CP-C) TaxID=290397 RepID=Q2IMQ5_ANADE|nr:LysR substrate-binding domain-containing protein [Anaeromyxobacter dehalogenans]ABC80088.1 transcriptional regulator, LysR family [Anaeromyxobacter dehalogenans 2CP-C]
MAITRLPPHPFSLRQLQYAIAVADTLSFRRAAERCRVAQPSLSTQVAQLESALGVRLFERDRRRVLVTGAGRPLLELMRRLLLQADDLQEAARQAGDPLAGALRVGVIPTISPYLLPAIAPALRDAYPALRLTWLEDRTAELVRSLHAGTLDAALLAVEAELGDVEVAPVARDAFVLATPPGHPLGAARGPASAAELRDASVLLLEDGHCLREQALAFCSRARTRELEYRATSLSTLAQMVAGGAGVTLLPELAVPTETRRADLRLRPFADPAPFRTIALVWRRSSPIAEALRRLAGTVKTAYPAPAGRPAGPERQRPRAPRA